MHPTLVHIGNLTIHSYGFCIMIGGLLALVYAYKFASDTLPKELIPPLFLVTILASVLGGKLFLLFENWNTTSLLSSNGFVFYGGLLFSAAAWFGFARIYHIPYFALLDLNARIGCIVLVFGKTGCLLAGCCYGKLCNPSFGMVFNDLNSAAHPLHVPLYPTQLFDMMCAIGLFIWLHSKQPKYHGELVMKGMLIYAVCRFVSEVFRGDVERGFIGNSSISNAQFVSMMLVAAALLIMPIIKRKQLL